MKYFVGCAIVMMAAVFATASAEADAGFFIPKAFYTLDAEGHKTKPHPVSPHTAQYLRRLRRQVYSSASSSSSSSSSSSNGGPVYFSTQNTVSHTPAGTVSFASRFGDDGSSVSSSSHSSSGVGVGGSAGVGSSIGVGSGYGGGYDNNNGNDYDDALYHGNNNAGYGINSNSGHVSSGHTPVQFANRFGGSSASSMSSVSSNGGPVYFKTEQSVSHTPTSGVNFASRFGDDSPPATVGKTVSTSGYIDENGVVHSKTTATKH